VAVDAAWARDVAWQAWAWVLDQVRWDDGGPWIPLSVPADGDVGSPPEDRDCLYDGVAGLAPALAEVRLSRPWDETEQVLADGVASRLLDPSTTTDCSLYVGLAGSLTAVTLLDASRSEALLTPLGDASTDVGWPSPVFGDPSRPVNDVVLGNAGVVMACGWLDDPRADELVAVGADALARAAIPADGGVAWRMHADDIDRMMPNYSHGTAGVAAALALAGHRLERPDLVETALRGAEHLVHIADLSRDGFRLPMRIPQGQDHEPYGYGWCHGPTGTAKMFGALRLARVGSVAGLPCSTWIERAARSVRDSGVPDRVRRGFWDNDGRCCGTAGVLEATLDQVQDTGDGAAAEFADRLAAALTERSLVAPDDPSRRYWRFREHRADPPDLDPGVGWMQGAAGIVAALLRYARVRADGLGAARVGRPDDWWMVSRAGPGPAPLSW